MKRLLLVVFLLGLGMAAQAAESPVSVSNARVRWLPGDLPLAGYFSITSREESPLRLVGFTSPAFGQVMMHRSVVEDGMQRMVDVEGLDLIRGETVAFAPGGYHLMLMDRKQTLQPGDEVPMTLRFSDGRTLDVPFRVEGVHAE